MSVLRVCVVYGGPSREHDVSVNSGKAMLANLDLEKYVGTGIFIDKDSKWHIGDAVLAEPEALLKIKESFDFALLGLHGTFGEDGEIQGLLDQHKIPYSGSGMEASKLAMEKNKTSLVYAEAGMKIPMERAITRKDKNILDGFSLPLVIKPAAQGSSVGVSIVTTVDDIPLALNTAFAEDDTALIQEYIKGREVSCGVIENEQGILVALPPTELIPVNAAFFDYEAKYTPGATKEITPPDLPSDVITNLQAIAIEAHRILGCSGYSRTDVIIRGKDQFLIETNTLPGMTATSILPQQAHAAGMTFTVLLDRIIAAGMRRKRV